MKTITLWNVLGTLTIVCVKIFGSSTPLRYHHCKDIIIVVECCCSYWVMCKMQKKFTRNLRFGVGFWCGLHLYVIETHERYV